MTRTNRVLLAGKPNSGKTSIFNALTGARQRVGNYPGVTVEKHLGEFRVGADAFRVTDLPGTYSLTSYSPEERIAQVELVRNGSSVVIVVVDSTALKRSLVLLTQIIQTGANPILCLNMSDEARDAGQLLDVDRLSSLLGFPVVETVAHRGQGVAELKMAIDDAVRHPYARNRVRLGERLESALRNIAEAIPPSAAAAKAREWMATKLLLGDIIHNERAEQLGPAGHPTMQIAARERERIESETRMDITLFVTTCYNAFVNGLLKEVVKQKPRDNAREASDAVDRVLSNRILGVPIFLTIMYGIFWLTFTLGEYPMTWIESGFSSLSGLVGGLWPAGADSPLRSLLVDGIIGGVGAVIVFLPNIILLFLGLALLEDTGYMARAAFLADGLMHRLGLHGRSFIPMMTGFGCSIPGIMATRTLENERDRLATMLVLPLMSCGARLPIWMLLVPAFFAPHLRAPVLWMIYLIGIILALALVLLLRQTLLKGEEAPFVMELPPYRLPTFRGILRKMSERSSVYLRKAGTLILGVSIVMWFVMSYPKMDHDSVDHPLAAGVENLTETEIEQRRLSEALQFSIAGRIGTYFEPAIKPLGFDWRLGTAMIGAFAAKEVFVAQMGIVYALGETDEASASLRDTLSRAYSPLAGVSLMLFLLIATPCMATVAITRRESGSWKWAMLQFGGLTAVAYVVSLLVYQIGSLFA